MILVDIFERQAEFMKAGDVAFPDRSQKASYLSFALIEEEFGELSEEPHFCIEDKETWNELKEVCDLIIVCANKLNVSVGPDKARLLLNAVFNNNMAKCIDGKLVKRKDGKIEKPEGFDKNAWMAGFEKILKGD